MAAKPNSTPVLEPVVIDDQKYQQIKEGQAIILTPLDGDATTAKPQSVFYNPIQQFNRDLSVLAIKTFGENLLRFRSRKEKPRDTNGTTDEGKRGKKRKRGTEAIAEGTGTDGTSEEQTSGEAAQAMEGVELPETEATAENVGTVSKHERSESSGRRFRVLDALSASGLRALRYAKEIPFITHVVANDLSSDATKAIRLNTRHNGVSDKVRAIAGDAIAHLYGVAYRTAGKTTDGLIHTKYEVIDLDPYGTAAPFLDAAVQSLSEGGMLCVTCTDAGVYASTGYLEKAYALYGGVTWKGPQSHEAGLRIILHSIATIAARYGIAIEPLLSLSIDFYARVFVRIKRFPSEVKLLPNKTMVVYNCDAGCGSWTTQYLSRATPTKDRKGDIVYKHSAAQGPTTSETCEHCGFKTHLAGPMWGGPLHNPFFVQKMLDEIPNLDETIYGTTKRIEGMLTLALHEADTMDVKDSEFANPNEGSTPAAQKDSTDTATKTERATVELPATSPSDDIMPRLDPALRDPAPFFVMPSVLARTLHCVQPPDNMFRSGLMSLGYQSTRSHCKPGSFRTNAPFSAIWQIMREWVAQKSPVKEGALTPGMAGWKILNQKPSDKRATSLQDDLSKVLKIGGSFEELKTSIEAALYRAEKAVEDNTEDTQRKVVFDAKLGKEPETKRLVRYQMNPTANWGPKSRAPVTMGKKGEQ